MSLPTPTARALPTVRGDPGIDPTRAGLRRIPDLSPRLVHRQGNLRVESFERALAGVFPDNRILSHDLLEAAMRAAAWQRRRALRIPAVALPRHVARRHRWIVRLADRELGAAARPTPDGIDARNPLDGLSRWKILDNLRRSLVAPAVVLVLLAGWRCRPFRLVDACDARRLFRADRRRVRARRLVAAAKRRRAAPPSPRLVGCLAPPEQALFLVACLPYEARVHLEAVVRAQWRTIVTDASCSNGARRRSSKTARAARERQRRGGPAAQLRRDELRTGARRLAAAWLVTAHPARFGSPRRFSSPGSSRRARLVAQPAAAQAHAPLAAEQLRFLRSSRVAPGRISRTSSTKRTTGCRRTTTRRRRSSVSRTARRRRTSVSRSPPTSLPGISAT